MEYLDWPEQLRRESFWLGSAEGWSITASHRGTWTAGRPEKAWDSFLHYLIKKAMERGQVWTVHVMSFRAHKTKLLNNLRLSWAQENFSSHHYMPESPPNDQQSLQDDLSSFGHIIPVSTDQSSPLFFLIFVHKIQGWSSRWRAWLRI